MGRFNIKISGIKKLSKDDIFPDTEMTFHPNSQDISEFLDGVSIQDLIANFNLLRDLELTFVDSETGDEWVYVGFGWNKI
jgi:hypothetical protein